MARRHFLLTKSSESVAAITGALVGLHATDPATPYLSLWARIPGFVTGDLDTELYQQRSVVKHLAMRRTLWVVNAEDLAMIQPAASDRVAANERRRLVADVQKAGVAQDGEGWLDAACAAVLRHLAEIGAEAVDLHGSPGFALADDLDPEPDTEPWCALLPGLDPTTMGWSQRDWYLGGHREQVFDRNGNAGPTAWWHGRVVGGWSQDADGRVQLQLLEDPGRDGRRALSKRADVLTTWLDGVRIPPRFPSPLSKARR